MAGNSTVAFLSKKLQPWEGSWHPTHLMSPRVISFCKTRRPQDWRQNVSAEWDDLGTVRVGGAPWDCRPHHFYILDILQLGFPKRFLQLEWWVVRI